MSTILLFKDVLEEMIAMGIDEAIIEPTKEGGTQIRAADKEHNIIMFDTLSEKLVEHALAIQSVRGLHSRMSLFDLEKASVEFQHNNDHIKNIVFKQGKRKVSFKPSNPKLINAPKTLPDLNFVGNEIVMTGEYANESIMPMLNSISLTGKKEESTVSIQVEGGEFEISFFDGEDDSATEGFTVEGDDIPKSSWAVHPFKRVLKQSTDRNGVAKISVTDVGIAIFEMHPVSVMIAPMVA